MIRSPLNKKQNGFAVIYLIISICAIILFSGILYFRHINTTRNGANSRKNISVPQPQVEEPAEARKVVKNEPPNPEKESTTKPKEPQKGQKIKAGAPEAPQKEQEKTLQHQRKDISFLRFVSSENCVYFLDGPEVSQLRSLNINGIRICPGYSVLPSGDIREDIPELWIVKLIERAHQTGFAVLLEPNFAGPKGFPSLSNQKYIDKLYNIALHWAETAERENVEFYSPLNEPNATFSNSDLVNKWISKSQDLKRFFSGNLVLKLADIGPENIEDITNYDYLAFDIMWGDSKYNELKNYLNLAISKANNLKQKYNLKGFFFGELGTERARVDKNVQAKIFETIFEETWKKVDGYCFLGWSNLEFRFKDNEKAKDIIREWYAK